VYPQGSVHHLRRGDVKQYKMDKDCFALEYARGWIPPMLFFGYADSKFSAECGQAGGTNVCSFLQHAGFPDFVAYDCSHWA
jgi:hypothetical protein